VELLIKPPYLILGLLSSFWVISKLLNRDQSSKEYRRLILVLRLVFVMPLIASCILFARYYYNM